MEKNTRRILIIGSTASGKTFYLKNVINMLPKANEIYFFSNSLEQNMDNYKKTMNNIHKHAKFNFINEIPDAGLMLNDSDNINRFKENKHTIIILDDVDIKDMKNLLIPFFTRGRHLGISVILIYQRYYDIPLTIRYNVDMLIIFRCQFGYDSLYQSIKGYIKKDDFYRIFNSLNDIRNKYCHINIDLNEFGENVIKKPERMIIFDK